MGTNTDNVQNLPEKFNLNFKFPKIQFHVAGWIKLLTFVIFLLILLYNSFTVYIKPNEFGIKQVKIGIKRGIHETPYMTGLHFVIPFMQIIHKMPRDKQVLELTNSPITSSNYATQEKAAHIQTSDGFFVDVDVSFIYHIENPYKVFTKIGPGFLFVDNGILPKAEPALKETLGELTTEEFYNSPLRVQKAEAAKKKLNGELIEKGIVVDHVLVRYFRYSEEIQKNIEEKKLKDQLVFKNKAEARAAIEGAKLKKIEQEGIVNVSVAMEQGKAYVTKKNAEKDLYARTKRAESNLLVKLAEAEKVRLKNEALKGKGAERMVGLKMADIYKGLDVIILPSDGPSGVNPLNLDNALKLFDVRTGGEK